jgi:hypothetical protein
MNAINIMARKCCSVEHDRLMKRLDRCDSRARTESERHLCYMKAARKSGLRAKSCVYGG